MTQHFHQTLGNDQNNSSFRGLVWKEYNRELSNGWKSTHMEQHAPIFNVCCETSVCFPKQNK